MDEIRDELKVTPLDDLDRLTELGLESLKLRIEEMVGIPTVHYAHADAFNTKYWTNWPLEGNEYVSVYWTWSIFKVLLPRVKSTGR
jgi:hypothetical protein